MPLTSLPLRSPLRDPDKGFTLIEVMVALVLLAITVAALMELFSSNLRTSKKASDYTEAIIIGTSEMEKALSGKIEPGTERIELKDYTVTREIRLLDTIEGIRIYEISVFVTWDNNNRYEIKSLRTVRKDEG